MDKLVIDRNNETFTIQTLYDLDEDSIWDEDIKVYHTYSKDGLINYRFESLNSLIVDENGNFLGIYETYFSSDLIGSEIY